MIVDIVKRRCLSVCSGDAVPKAARRFSTSLRLFSERSTVKSQRCGPHAVRRAVYEDFPWLQRYSERLQQNFFSRSIN